MIQGVPTQRKYIGVYVYMFPCSQGYKSFNYKTNNK